MGTVRDGKRKRGKVSGFIAAIPAVTFGASFLQAIPVTADARGFQEYSSSSFSIGTRTFHVSSGTIAHMILGNGRYVRTQQGEAGVDVCYGAINWVQRGTSSKILNRIPGNERYGCSFSIIRTRGSLSFPMNVRKACAELQLNDVRKGMKCHTIS